jgi:hypothetical protein
MSVLAALVSDWGVGRFVVTVASGILDRHGIPVRHGACRQCPKDDRCHHEQHMDFQKMPHALSMRCA